MASVYLAQFRKENKMTKWEYKTILRRRGFDAEKKNSEIAWFVGGEWSIDIDETLKELGDVGWELVTVTPRSRYLGGKYAGYSGFISTDFAGFTNEELWVFKRPISD
jgi:hypothetical protein